MSTEEAVETAVKDRFVPILRKLDNIQATVDVLARDLDTDRVNIAEIRTSQAKTEQMSIQLLEIFKKSNQRIVEKIIDKTAEVTQDAAQAVTDAIEPAAAKIVRKMGRGIPLQEGVSYWKRLVAWFRKKVIK